MPATLPSLALETKPDADRALDRLEAWYVQQIIDRPPVRFSRHNAFVEQASGDMSRWPSLKARWFDVDYQIEKFLADIEGKSFLGETFPIFWPNLGPNFFAGLYGAPLEFGDVTSWAHPILTDYADPPHINWQSEYLLKLDELTRAALEVASDRFYVGYTDLHPGMDWLLALRGGQDLALDLYDQPEVVHTLLEQVTQDFLAVYDHYDAMLKAAGQPSSSWMALPFRGRMHIPSCDFGAMISPKQFRQFAVPSLTTEVLAMTHNVFHLDGKNLARSIEAILALPNVNAIQWVQGVGDDQPILQWIPFIKKLQAAGKSVIVDMEPSELEPLIAQLRPEGILLCLPSENEEHERALLETIAKWK